MLRLHREMFGRAWTWAGAIRTHENNMGSQPHRIQVELLELERDLATWSGTSMSLVEQAVHLHHRPVRIHPFPNGNGRWARMLASIWLARHGGRLIEWPEATTGSAGGIRGEYLAAVKAADSGDAQELPVLHERYLRRPARWAQASGRHSSDSEKKSESIL